MENKLIGVLLILLMFVVVWFIFLMPLLANTLGGALTSIISAVVLIGFFVLVILKGF